MLPLLRALFKDLFSLQYLGGHLLCGDHDIRDQRRCLHRCLGRVYQLYANTGETMRAGGQKNAFRPSTGPNGMWTEGEHMISSP